MKGTIRKRGETWTYQFAVPQAGKRRTISKGGFRTKRAAQEALTEALASYSKGEHVEPSRLTLRDYLVDEWLQIQAARLKPSTHRGYRDIIDKRVLPHLGDVRLSELTGGHVARLYATLRETGGRDGQGLSERSLKHTHTCLGKALEDAARRRLIARNPVRDVEPPRPRNAEMKVWTADELRGFLADTATDRLYAAWYLAAMTGLRRGELLGLRWEDIDLEAGVVSVRRARVAAGYDVHEGEPKSGRARTVDIDDATVLVLRQHRRRQITEREVFGLHEVGSGPVFTREDGSPLHPQTLAWYFEKAVKRSGVPAIRFHDLRHTHATLALKAGVHPKVVQERLGHSSISITLDLYSHVVPGMQAEAAAKVAAVVFGA